MHNDKISGILGIDFYTEDSCGIWVEYLIKIKILILW